VKYLNLSISPERSHESTMTFWHVPFTQMSCWANKHHLVGCLSSRCRSLPARPSSQRDRRRRHPPIAWSTSAEQSPLWRAKTKKDVIAHLTQIISNYRAGHIRRGQLTFLLVTSERICKIK